MTSERTHHVSLLTPHSSLLTPHVIVDTAPASQSASGDKPWRCRPRRFTYLLSLLIIGCIANPVGPAPAAPRTTSGLYFFAAPGADVRFHIISGTVPITGRDYTFVRDAALDNFERPAATEPSFVAYSTGQIKFDSNSTYTGEIQRPDLLPNTWKRVDEISEFTPNTREWYRIEQGPQ